MWTPAQGKLWGVGNARKAKYGFDPAQSFVVEPADAQDRQA